MINQNRWKGGVENVCLPSHHDIFEWNRPRMRSDFEVPESELQPNQML